MEVTGISLIATTAAAGNPEATPELLAACLARYSRSNKGIRAILEEVDPSDHDKSVEKVFRFVDYGHSSISGLTGAIPLAVDGVSMLLAYKLFEFAQQADGQESSTRYIKMSADNLPSADSLGIPKELGEAWIQVMTLSLLVYEDLHRALESQIASNPTLITAKPGTSEKATERLRRNFALDRVRYVLPWALKTNIALVMSARAWSEVIRQAEALKLPESLELAAKLRAELVKYTPRLIKHSTAGSSDIIQAQSVLSYTKNKILSDGVSVSFLPDEVVLNIEKSPPALWDSQSSLAEAFEGKDNRYGSIGAALRRIIVRFGWNNIALAELRDLNRHRTGYRFSPLVPKGFYLPEGVTHPRLEELLSKYQKLIVQLAQKAQHGIFLYGYLLGTQVSFEHSTQADKLIYEIELRTGDGAHFRYAEHLRAIAKELFKAVPEIEPYVKIGTAEPDWEALK